MFALKQTAKLSNVNARAELHGDEHVIAVDLKIEAKLGNEVLSEFHSDLRHFLYTKDESPDQAELALDENRMSKLRFGPLLSHLKWGFEGAGYRLKIDWGISHDSAIFLGDCEVDHVGIHPQEGGTVALTFRVIAHPEQDDIGKLVSLIQQEVSIDLEPPSTNNEPELPDTDEAPKKKRKSKAERLAEAEALFVAGEPETCDA